MACANGLTTTYGDGGADRLTSLTSPCGGVTCSGSQGITLLYELNPLG